MDLMQWFIYNFGLMGTGTRCFQINESNCKLISPEHFLMISLQYYCILGLAENFASQRQNYAQKMQDAQVTKSLLTT